MNKALNQFDAVAKYYDKLSIFIFGNSIQKSQLHFLTDDFVTGNVLIIGGGTGWLAKEVLLRFQKVHVVYIDASSKMIKQTKKIVASFGDRITVIHGTEESIPVDLKFDTVIANFYFDLFTERSIHGAIGQIEKSVNRNSTWLVTDFVDENKWWQKKLLRLMFLFFNRTCGLQLKELVKWQNALEANRLRRIESEQFYKGFICASVFTRQ
jgi:ubiquinone/menaquinone biosynthesis C-methylase UbiE